MSAMLLVIPRHALNVPFSRWSVATMFVVGTTVTGHPPRPLGTLVTLGLIATVSVAFALSTTFYLRARGDELRVVTVYKRSSLAAARSWFRSATVGRGRAQSWVLTVSDGGVKRKLKTYYLFNWFAELAVRRLQKHLLPANERESGKRF